MSMQYLLSAQRHIHRTIIFAVHDGLADDTLQETGQLY